MIDIHITTYFSTLVLRYRDAIRIYCTPYNIALA